MHNLCVRVGNSLSAIEQVLLPIAAHLVHSALLHELRTHAARIDAHGFVACFVFRKLLIIYAIGGFTDSSYSTFHVCLYSLHFDDTHVWYLINDSYLDRNGSQMRFRVSNGCGGKLKFQSMM